MIFVLRARTSISVLQLTVLFVVHQDVVLGDLKADTLYSVSVGAYTAKGDGARSKPVNVCTALPCKWEHEAREHNKAHITSNDL